MKTLIIAAITALSLSSFANTTESVFKKDSPISNELQTRILETIKARCSNLITAYGLTEVTTSVRAEKIDQGITDFYYTTEFSSRFYFDGMHPSHTSIVVESAEYDFQNGDNLEVSSITSPAGCE